MKKALFFLSLSILLTQCSTESEPELLDTENSNAKETAPATLSPDSAKNESISVSVSTAPITNDVEDGEYLTKYPNGNMKVKGYIEEGKRVGLWIAYFENGSKQSENNYINGLASGKTVVYYPNGQIMYIGYYNNGQTDGQWLYFDEKGTMTKNLLYNAGVASEQPIE